MASIGISGWRISSASTGASCSVGRAVGTHLRFQKTKSSEVRLERETFSKVRAPLVWLMITSVPD
jgi:hypothetical protein